MLFKVIAELRRIDKRRALLSIYKDKIVQRHSKSVFFWVPCTQLNFSFYVQVRDFHLVWISYPFSFIWSKATNSSASFLHKFDINRTILRCIYINHMSIRVIGSCKDLSGVRRNLQVKFVKNSFIFVDFTQLFIQVFGHIKRSDRCLIVPYIPNVHRHVVS